MITLMNAIHPIVYMDGMIPIRQMPLQSYENRPRTAIIATIAPFLSRSIWVIQSCADYLAWTTLEFGVFK